MRISIVIPTYNGSKYIREAIESALNQTRPADEIIVSDDNSSDDTLKICNNYSDKIKIFKNPNGPSGFVNGWNIAIRHAKSEFISILHQDDILAPNFLEEVENAYNLYPEVKHFFASCNYIDAEGSTIRQTMNNYPNELKFYSGQEYAETYELFPNHIHRCPGVVTSKEILEKSPYREIAGHIADDDFFMRVGNWTNVVGILKPLAYYREHNGSETGHLDILKLNKRLLRDVHFQLKHRLENPMINDRIANYLQDMETRYIHRVCVFGLKRCNVKYIFTGIKYWFTLDHKKGFRNIMHDLKRLFR